MSFELLRGDARKVSDLLAPASVDLFVTSPPYFALRSYRDECEDCDGTGEVAPDVTPSRIDVRKSTGGPPTLQGGDRRKRSDLGADGAGNCPACSGTGRSHFDGQLGSEATPGEFVDALIECTRDWLKVLKPGGSIFVNLGDKRAGSGGHNNANLSRWHTAPLDHNTRPEGLEKRDANVSEQIAATRRNAPDRYNQASDGIPAKSLMGLPWRYALRCVDELGLILRADIIWHKPNGLPESVTDRVRQSHEYWFHLTREARYFAAVDEVREAHAPWTLKAYEYEQKARQRGDGYNRKVNSDRVDQGDAGDYAVANPLGKLPGSVWTIPSEPLTVPNPVGVDHFAAFPSEWPRRLILGWSPTGWCESCGEARRAVVERTATGRVEDPAAWSETVMFHDRGNGGINKTPFQRDVTATILGYACACPDPTAPIRPAVVLDPFAGTGTTVAVAHHLGRHGIGIDLSKDYLRLAEWRCEHDTALRDKVLSRSDLPKAPKIDGQLALDFL